MPSAKVTSGIAVTLVFASMFSVWEHERAADGNWYETQPLRARSCHISDREATQGEVVCRTVTSEAKWGDDIDVRQGALALGGMMIVLELALVILLINLLMGRPRMWLIRGVGGLGLVAIAVFARGGHATLGAGYVLAIAGFALALLSPDQPDDPNAIAPLAPRLDPPAEDATGS